MQSSDDSVQVESPTPSPVHRIWRFYWFLDVVAIVVLSVGADLLVRYWVRV